MNCQCSTDGCSINAPYMRTFSGMCKFFEITLVASAFGIYRIADKASFGGGHANVFGGGVMVAALIITPLLLLCYFCGRLDVQSTTVLEPAINSVLCLFFFIAGSYAIGSHYFFSVIMGALLVSAAIVYLADNMQRYIRCDYN
ncbi:unnamed protein product [Meganyctiphanes norvegica]|uniref:Uncharacterized protein n=1 Tax=Meganyctiphanes norvegica TaxID=48144 RepID=A0AAV2S081_MEGNR